MAQRKLLTNGSAFVRTDGRWAGVVWYMDERGSYDWLECTAKHQIYPILGKKVVGDVTSADVRKLLNHWMNEGYAYTTIKKVYNLLTDYFRYLTQQELIPKNPMTAAPMIKKANSPRRAKRTARLRKQ